MQCSVNLVPLCLSSADNVVKPHFHFWYEGSSEFVSMVKQVDVGNE